MTFLAHEDIEYMEEKKMKRIAAFLAAALFVISLSIASPETLFASEEEESEKMLLQDEEQEHLSDEEFEHMMKELEESLEVEEQPDIEEQNYPDEKYPGDRG
jgi:Zn-dependent M16 (insulinase) family peptidase